MSLYLSLPETKVKESLVINFLINIFEKNIFVEKNNVGTIFDSIEIFVDIDALFAIRH
jgi:hypothetical protein